MLKEKTQVRNTQASSYKLNPDAVNHNSQCMDLMLQSPGHPVKSFKHVPMQPNIKELKHQLEAPPIRRVVQNTRNLPGIKEIQVFSGQGIFQCYFNPATPEWPCSDVKALLSCSLTAMNEC